MYVPSAAPQYGLRKSAPQLPFSLVSVEKILKSIELRVNTNCLAKRNCGSRYLRHNTNARTQMQQRSKVNILNSHICLPSHLWILFWILFTSMSPHSCIGPCTNTRLQQIQITVMPALSRVNLYSHFVAIRFNLSQ